MFCPDTPSVIVQIGHLALTTRSVPSLVAVPIYLAVFGYLSVRSGVLGRRDLFLWLGVSLLQFFFATLILTFGGTELGVFFLAWPFLVFMVGYGIQRRRGKPPLRDCPWHRFGLLVTLTMLTVDILVGLALPSAADHVWQLGGACLNDALVLAPAVLTLAFYGLLDCRSPFAYCSRQCETAGRCLHSAGENPVDVAMRNPASKGRSVVLGLLYGMARTVIAIVAGFAVILAFEGIARIDPAPAPAVINSDLSARLQAEAARMASKHEITAPIVSVTQSDVAGVTLPPQTGMRTSPSVILLGSPIQKGRFLVEPDLQLAVLAHEFGHALQNSRGDGFPILLIGFVMAIPMAGILLAFATIRGIFLGATLILALLWALLMTSVSAHKAVQWVVMGWLAFGLLEWLMGKDIRRELSLPSGAARLMSALSPHLPSRRATVISALSASLAFFWIGYRVGQMNEQHELRSDLVGACEVSPRAMMAALTELQGREPQPGDTFMGRLLDPFHPPMTLRLVRLERMMDAGPDSTACPPQTARPAGI